MIDLARHIEILLLDNDCVIVPGFGGFVTHQAQAYYDERDHMLLPPKRTLGFNPQLRLNDSLLVQSYINAYDVSYPEAMHRIEDEVEELKDYMDVRGYYTLDDIGTLTMNSEGNIEFEPCEAGILTPEYYGLGACEFRLLKETRAIANNSLALPAQPEQPVGEGPLLLDFTDIQDDDEDEKTIRIKMSWIRNTIAVAAAIVAFFVMATPIANSDLNTRTMTNLQSQFLQQLVPQDTKVVPVTTATQDAQTAQVALATENVMDSQDAPTTQTSDSQPTQEAAQPAPKAQPAQMTQNAPQKAQAAPKTQPAPQKATTTYCIVLASQVKKSNAENYVEQLRKRGYDKAKVFILDGVVRVICGTYQDESEAYRQLHKLNNKDEFYDAWVFKTKEAV